MFLSLLNSIFIYLLLQIKLFFLILLCHKQLVDDSALKVFY